MILFLIHALKWNLLRSHSSTQTAILDLEDPEKLAVVLGYGPTNSVDRVWDWPSLEN